MPLVSLRDLMADAEAESYCVGYFESWNMESLQAVIEAAEQARSPVIVGFSGIQLPDERRAIPERLELYAALGLAACKTASVPTAFIFNESSYFDWVERAVELGFNIVMFSDEEASLEEQKEMTRRAVEIAHPRGVAVEAEISALLGAGTSDVPLTDPAAAREFVEETGVDLLSVSTGNIHLHGKKKVKLDIKHLDALCKEVKVPLGIHGGTSVDDDSIREAVKHGLRKVNIGSILKQTVFTAVKKRILSIDEAAASPYELLGSGTDSDVLQAGRDAMRQVVMEKMSVFGSAGKA